MEGGRFLAQIRASKSPRTGQRIDIDGADECEYLVVEGREGPFFVLSARGVDDLASWLSRVGHMPLPPYINRADTPADRDRYQTIYAETPGAVAAPTAGLHLDESMLAEIRAMGVDISRLTLHIGAGTFQPVRCETMEEHVMHPERVVVSPELCDAVAATRKREGRVVAVGTTVVRALESAASDGELQPFDGETSIFIHPGFHFRVVDALLTNFHLPESTLLMLVSAFAGYDVVMAAYRHAVARGYRFFSYGDAMFLCPNIFEVPR
jgi:S-adenosylmethionine:tRNA ribosyltransferase-isomerase